MLCKFHTGFKLMCIFGGTNMNKDVTGFRTPPGNNSQESARLSYIQYFESAVVESGTSTHNIYMYRHIYMCIYVYVYVCVYIYIYAHIYI